jgi:hypothetical protein
MDELITTTDFDDRTMEILLPETKACPNGTVSRCDCCGRPATLDEDCCGICEECLAPSVLAGVYRRA